MITQLNIYLSTLNCAALVSPELHVEGDDGQPAEALRAAGEGRPQPGGGEHEAQGGRRQ